MKFEEIIKTLSQNECIEINGGEVLIQRKLDCVIGGVSIYRIMVSFPKENFEPEYFDTIDELDDWSMVNFEKNIRRCSVCNEIPVSSDQEEQRKVKGYFYDKEMNQYYCCKECRDIWFDTIYGDDWKVEKKEFMGINTYIKYETDNEWKPYNLKFIRPFDGCE